LQQVFDDFTLDGLPVSDRVIFSTAVSWWITVNRIARTIICLYDAGLGGDAAPQIRSMVEYCLRLVAFVQDPERLSKNVLRESRDYDKGLRAQAVNGPFALPSAISELIDSTPLVEGNGSPVKSFLAIFRALGVDSTIGVYWRILSSLAHPTLASAALLSLPTVDGVKISKEPKLPPGLNRQAFEHMALTAVIECSILAGLALDRILSSQPMRPLLQPVMDEVGVTDIPLLRTDG
jgi:hypothetical protein